MSKKRNRGKGPAEEKLLERAQRELARGNSRQALKDARVCFRTAATDEHRQFLERAYVARIEDQQKAGFHDQARVTWDELQKLGVTVPEVQQKLPRLQILLGAGSSPQSAQPTAILETNPELLSLLADQAVLHPERATAVSADMRQEAAAVRAALQAIERGDEAVATEQLNGIARQSPLAEWKLFARGLSAHYAGQPDRRQANWERLDPQRAAQRIAQTLLVFSGEVPAEQAPPLVAQGVRRLKYALQGSSVSEQIRLLADHAKADRGRDLLLVFRSLRQRFGQSDPVVIEKITDLLWKRAVREGSHRDLDALTKAAPAPALDPHWHRASALLAGETERFDMQVFEDAWKRFIPDLQQSGVLGEQERAIAVALVYRHVALEFVQHAQALSAEGFRFSWSPPNPGHLKTIRNQAVHYYRESLKHCPRLRSAYGELVDLHLDMEQPAQAAKVYEGLLAHFPDDYDTLAWLANHYLDADEPAKGRPHVAAAQRVKPRDPRTLRMVWNQQLLVARHATRKRKFDEARQALDVAAAVITLDTTEPYWLDGLRAAVEYKAGNPEAAQQHLNAALVHFHEPTTIWLMMSSCAVRYGLAKPLKKEFDTKLKAAIGSSEPRSQTAGRMAKFLLPSVVRETKASKYVGLVTHQRLVLTYLQRCRNVSWVVEDLRSVCEFLGCIEGWRNQSLLREFVRRGLLLFPQDPCFHFWSGELEVRKGPYACNAEQARRHLERALELHKAGGVPLSEDLVRRAKHALTLLEGATSFLDGMCSLGEDDEDEFDDDEDDEDEFDDDEDAFGTSPFPGGQLPPNMSEADLRRMLPPQLFAAFQAECDKFGMSVQEAIARFTRRGGEADETHEAKPEAKETQAYDEWADAPDWLQPPPGRSQKKSTAGRRR